MVWGPKAAFIPSYILPMLPDWAARSMESHSLHQKSLAQYLERVLTFLRANCRQAKVSLQGLLL